MIKCYSWPTPNGIKIHIMLEECQLDYEVYGIDITKGEQFKTSFLKISPNNKMPAIIDSEGPGKKPLSIFESGAILMYLAEKTGKFLPKQKREKYKVIQWLMFQMGGVGPMLGQSNFFHHYSFMGSMLIYQINPIWAIRDQVGQPNLSNQRQRWQDFSIRLMSIECMSAVYAKGGLTI